MKGLYPNSIKALAIEMVCSGVTISRVSEILKIPQITISRWYSNYLGYKGKEPFIIKKESIINIAE